MRGNGCLLFGGIILTGFTSIITIVVLTLLGPSIGNVFSNIVTEFDSTTIVPSPTAILPTLIPLTTEVPILCTVSVEADTTLDLFEDLTFSVAQVVDVFAGEELYVFDITLVDGVVYYNLEVVEGQSGWVASSVLTNTDTCPVS